MKLSAVFFSVLLMCLALRGAEGGFEFGLNGFAFTPYSFCIHHSGELHEDDLISVHNSLMLLGTPGVYNFQTSSHDDGRLFRIMPDGSKTIAAFHIRHSYKDKGENYRNFNALTPDEMAGLSGIFIEIWSDEIAEKLKQMNLSRACISLGNGASVNGAVPPIPENTQFLYITENSNKSFTDFSHLEKLKDLKFFYIVHMGEKAFDIDLLSGSRNLEALGINLVYGASANNFDKINSFAKLKYLLLSGCVKLENIKFLENTPDIMFLDLKESGVKDISECSGLKKLEYMDVSMTEIQNLAPLANLENLKTVKANLSMVSALPMTKLQSLSEIWLFSSMLTNAEVDAFAKLNPQCRKIYFSYNDSLKAATETADTVKIRLSEPAEKDQIIYEMKKTSEIKELIENMKVIKPNNKEVFHCMCNGNPHFDFYRDAKLLTTVSMHHGTSLRWEWISDAKLEDASGEYLCNLLLKHGYQDARTERDSNKKSFSALERRLKKTETYFPKGVFKKIWKERNSDAIKKELKKLPGTETDKLIMFFKAFDCDDCFWDISAGFDSTLAFVILPEFDEKTMLDAVKKIDGQEGINGAARWFFFNGERSCRQYKAEDLDIMIPSLAEAGLSHPRKMNRAITLYALSALNTPEARKWLFKCFNEEIKARSIAPENIENPGGLKVSTSATFFDEGASDWAIAADMIIRSGDKSIIPSVRKKLQKASAEDKKLLSTHLK